MTPNQEVVARFEREYQAYHRISTERARQQRKLLLEFGDDLGGRSLTEVTAADIQAVAGRWLSGGLHVNTVRKRLNMLRSFFGWAYAVRLVTAEQYMDIRTVKDPRGATGKTLPKPYKRPEIMQLWRDIESALPKVPAKGKGSQAIKRFMAGRGPWRNVWKHAMRLQVDAMVRLALDLGLRRNEIYGLSVDDLHYENEYLVVRGKADPNTGEPKIRKVPFTENARDAIRVWLEFRLAVMKPDHDRPWLACWGSRTYNKPMLERRFNTLLQSVVAPSWRWHRLRHTCATNWLRAGAELETVSALLGHASLQQTLGYAEILKSDVAAKLGRVEADFRKLTDEEEDPDARAA